MRYLLGCISLLIASTVVYAEQPVGIVTFTFDDSLRSQYVKMLPIATKYNIVGTLFLATGCIPTTKSAQKHSHCMSWGEAASFTGWEKASHTVTHPHFRRLSRAKIQRELQLSADAIELHINVPVSSFALPFGEYKEEQLTLVRKVYEYNALAKFRSSGLNPIGATDPMRIERYYVSGTSTSDDVCKAIADAAEKRMWLVLMMHGVVDKRPGPYEMTTKTFEEIAVCASALRDLGVISIETFNNAAAKAVAP